MAADITDLTDHKNLETILNSLLVDITAQKAAIDTMATKMNTDFTGQNGAVTSSELDVDYAGSGALVTTL
jgi:hypothetical protein